MTHLQDPVMAAGEFAQLECFPSRCGQGFFDQKVKAAFQQKTGDFEVEVGWDGDGRGVGSGRDFLERGEDTCAAPVGNFPGPGGVGIEYAYQLGTRAGLCEDPRMPLAE